MDPVSIMSGEVRELIRRRGLDPARDVSGLRRLVEDVVADYDARSSTGVLPALTDGPRAVKQVIDQVAGFGAVQQYLDDPTVEEIWINEPGKVFVARNGVSELTTTILTAQEVDDLVERMLKNSGRRVDLSTPFVDAALPDGSRLHVAAPDVTARHLAVNIRKFVIRAARLDQLVGLGTLNRPVARFLAAAVSAGLNVLVSGGTQAGKTTMLNCLVNAVPARERVITCEEVFELRAERRDLVAMQCRQPNLEGSGEIPLRRLVIEALRMRPDRIVVGEVRQAESLDLLLALNAGVPGMASVHANSAREALTKICTLPLLAGENISSRFVVPTVAAAIDVVVQLRLERDGRRQVQEVVAVPGRSENGTIETAQLFSRRGGELVRDAGFPPHPERFERAGFDLPTLLAG